MERPRTVRAVVRRGSKRAGADKVGQDVRQPTAATSLPAGITSKWAWHYRVLATLRERMVQDRRERLAEAAQPLEPHSMDPADSATDELDHNLALAALNSKQDALQEIDAAIRRLHSGGYGVCEATGKPIPAARLKAIPWTRFRCEVEALLEKDGEIRRPYLGPLSSVRGALPESLELSDAAAEDRSPEESNEPGPEVAVEVEARNRRRAERRDTDDEQT